MKNQIFRPKILHRKRINEILSQIFEVPIFFISASMGYGKTMAVKNFLEKNKDIEFIWFGTANEESDDIWMWHKLCKAIESTDFELSKKLNSYGFPRSNMDIYRVINEIREAVDKRIILVIDDWDDTKIAYINRLIKFIAFEEIPNLHIVIISRNKPSSQYIELELKQRCLVMWQNDIAFTIEETVEFFEINGIKLTQKEIEEIYSYTEGWILATYLALLQYNSTNTFNNIPRATEILKNSVYDKFNETTKKIILKLAPVESFTLEQAVYITGNIEANDVIKELASNNCFIKYDDKSQRYTLHSTLRNVLNEEFVLLNLDSNKINNACGDWYSKDFKDSEAMEYYYKAKNYDRILDLIERNKTIDLTNLWRRIINSVFDELSMEQKINRPIAYLIYIFFYITYTNPKKGKDLLYELWVIYEVDEELNDRNQILGEISFVESLLMMDDFKKMTEYHKKAYDLFQGGTSKVANNKMPITFGSPNFLSLFYKEKGGLKDLAEYLKKELVYFIHISNGGAVGIDYLISAEYLFETGDVYNGELLAYKALYKAKLKNQASIIICSLFLLMRIYINKGDKIRFRSNYNNLIEECGKLNIPRFLDGTEVALRYIDGITGKLDNMYKLDKEPETLNLQIIATPVTNMKYIISALGMVLKKSYIELEIHAEIMLEDYLRKNYIYGALYAYMFDSIAKYNLYGTQEAKKALLKAVDLAKEDRMIMCFVELSPHILPILKALKEDDEYVKMLLPRCEKFNEIYIRNNSGIEKLELTPRELEVIKLVYEGYKQSEISAKLNIALVTVKKHIASIYDKLNVKNKMAAINLLKEKGII